MGAPASAQGIHLPSDKIAELEMTALTDSTDAQALYYLGLGYWQHERYRQADSALRLAITIDPRDAEAYLALSYLPYAERNQLSDEEYEGKIPKEWRDSLDNAHRWYRRAFVVNPLVDLSIINFTFPVESKDFHQDYTSDESKEYELYYEGSVDLGAGRYEAAYIRLRHLAEKEYGRRDKIPDLLLWQRALAAAHTLAYRDSAVGDLQTLLDRSLKKESQTGIVRVPLNTNEYRYLLAVVHHAAGRDEKAIPLFQEAIANDIGLFMAHVYLAGIYESQGKWDDALAERRHAVDASPDEATLYEELGTTLYNTGRYAAADTVYRQALRINPRGTFPHYALGLIALQLNQPQEARTQFTDYLELAPARMAAYVVDARKRLAALQ
jgi:Tfp pilus assembly protein PilF